MALFLNGTRGNHVAKKRFTPQLPRYCDLCGHGVAKACDPSCRHTRFVGLGSAAGSCRFATPGARQAFSERTNALSANAEPQTDTSIFKRLLREARPYWPHLFGILIIQLLAMPLALLTPVPLKLVVDSVLGSEPLPAFLSAALPDVVLQNFSLLSIAISLLLLTALLTQVQQIGSAYLAAYAGGKMVLDFRNRLFSHGQRLSLSRHDMKGTSDALYRIQYDTASIENVAVQGLIPMITAAATVVAMVYVTMRINMQLALVALAIAPAFVLLTHFYRRPLRQRWRQQKMLDHAAMSVISEVFSSLRVVKAFTQEEREEGRYSDRANRGLRSKLNVTLLQGSFDMSASLTTAVGTGVVLFFGVRAIQADAMTVGDLLVVMSYLSMLYSPTQDHRRASGRVAEFTGKCRTCILVAR